MASLIATSTDLVTRLGISQVSAQKVYAHQPRSEKELRSILTTAVYDALVTALPGSDAAALNAAQAAYAEALLALHHSLPTLGFRIADEGGLVSSFGMGDYAGQLLSPYQLGALEKKIYGKAMEAIAELKPALTDVFTELEDQQAQYQANGFGITAVGGTEDMGNYDARRGVWQ